MISLKAKCPGAAATVQSTNNNNHIQNTTKEEKVQTEKKDLSFTEWQLHKIETLIRSTFYYDMSERDKKWMILAAHEILDRLIEWERKL